MGKSLRRRTGRRSKGSNRNQRSKSQVGFVVVMILLTFLLCEQVLAHWNHYQEIVKEPITTTKVIYKTKVKTKIKKVYINRRKVQYNGQGVERWRPLVSKYFGSATPQALAIIKCESGGNPNATNHNSNGSTDRGLFQINSCHGANSTYNVEANIAYAYKLSRGGRNWSPWVCSRKIGIN